ncbi:MAG: hypothetical protein JRC68_01670 [Deltaproteobacteria bacterium]|nr:hypothetical protein [Deltaproteobacteria bacterium]
MKGDAIATKSPWVVIINLTVAGVALKASRMGLSTGAIIASAIIVNDPEARMTNTVKRLRGACQDIGNDRFEF